MSNSNLMDTSVGDGCLVVIGIVVIGGLAIWKLIDLLAFLPIHDWICK